MEQTYGTVTYKRIISDNDHGNVQAERCIPVLVQGEITARAINQATAAAWDAAVEQVNEIINRAFELEGMAAPCYDGPRYNVARWKPDDSVILIIPQGSHPPGDFYIHYSGKARRLHDARKLADRIVERDRSISELLDFSAGDFTVLEDRLEALRAQAATLNHDPEEDTDEF